MGKGTPILIPANAPLAGETYKHYKQGDLYKIVGIALDSADQWAVVYEPMYQNAAAAMFTRPLAEWREVVEWEGKKAQRFSKI